MYSTVLNALASGPIRRSERSFQPFFDMLCFSTAALLAANKGKASCNAASDSIAGD